MHIMVPQSCCMGRQGKKHAYHGATVVLYGWAVKEKCISWYHSRAVWVGSERNMHIMVPQSCCMSGQGMVH